MVNNSDHILSDVVERFVTHLNTISNDYWYDIGVNDARLDLCYFKKRDWEILTTILPSKPKTLLERFIDCMYGLWDDDSSETLNAVISLINIKDQGILETFIPGLVYSGIDLEIIELGPLVNKLIEIALNKTDHSIDHKVYEELLSRIEHRLCENKKTMMNT